MECPFNCPKCLCQYCSLERCEAGCDKENLRCGFCVENDKQMWSKILCKNFTPLDKEQMLENLRELHPGVPDEELRQYLPVTDP